MTPELLLGGFAVVAVVCFAYVLVHIVALWWAGML